MEELTVEAIMGSLGYGSFEEYQRILNNLWETAPDEYEPLLLELESRQYKDAIIYLMQRFPSFSNCDKVAVLHYIFNFLLKSLAVLHIQYGASYLKRSIWKNHSIL